LKLTDYELRFNQSCS